MRIGDACRSIYKSISCVYSFIYIYSFPVAGFDWSLHFKWESLPNSGVAKQDATDAFL